MKKLSTNKEGRSIYRRYLESDTYSVIEAYKTQPSVYKEEAENRIKAEMLEKGGQAYSVISHNGFQFTCGYMIIDTETGNDIFVYHTKTRREEFLIDVDISI